MCCSCPNHPLWHVNGGWGGEKVGRGRGDAAADLGNLLEGGLPVEGNLEVELALERVELARMRLLRSRQAFRCLACGCFGLFGARLQMSRRIS